MAGDDLIITGAVEGDLDETVLRRIVGHVGLSMGAVYGRQGKPTLLQSLPGYNNAARHAPWIVLVDLDRDCDCAPPCLGKWLPAPAPLMRFRIAVRAVEAWLLADKERVARLFHVAAARIPSNPDDLVDPKDCLINVARHSRRKAIRDGIVPKPTSGRRVGQLYNSILSEFVQDPQGGWRPQVAQRHSPSLARCVESLRGIAGGTE